ncbi:MAG: type II toxin-antitoxin system VapC family toxin [Deltaproteobacteria bacterium]|nr:type II toxin-antitoxin system VapC family toxin [Deltaproteobacteria bacterium]MBW2532224.1 type II toxin-antitoxin system VapC family toxin [Deltaproteobacteria bacterium]
MIVADTNLLSYLLIEGDRTAAARKVWQRDPQWRVPSLWRAEFLNVLATAVSVRVLDEPDALRAWTAAKRLLTGREIQPAGQSVLHAAIRDRISAYDAQFVVVAEQLGVTLVTADRKLLRARRDLAVSIESFARMR